MTPSPKKSLGTGLLAVVGTALAAGAGALVYANRVEPKWLDVNPVRLRLPRLEPAFDGFRIAQFSDLHMELWRDWDTLQRVIDETNAFEPDLVILTGDYVHEDVADIGERLSAMLKQLRPREATLAVMGNHDYWMDPGAVRRVIARAGILDISNNVYSIQRDQAQLHIAGVDSMVEFRARFDIVAKCLPDEGAALLVVHEPDFAYISAPTRRFDLQLSGHSHGGQVRVPVLMDMALPAFARRFNSGLRRVQGMYVYTNRGLGTSGVRLRFNCRPELTLFILEAGAQPDTFIWQ